MPASQQPSNQALDAPVILRRSPGGVTGRSDFNDEQPAHASPTSWLSYIGSSTFWESTLQNWQSEFLAVGSFAVITICLRQHGSPESKPVGAPTRDATGDVGWTIEAE